jgi:hypothetical protein
MNWHEVIVALMADAEKRFKESQALTDASASNLADTQLIAAFIKSSEGGILTSLARALNAGLASS